jgi:hypothetical protein
LLKRRKVTQVDKEETGGAVPHYITNQSTGMRKGSIVVQGFAAEGFNAVRVVTGAVERRGHTNREELLSSRQAKGTWCVVFCIAKLYGSTEAAHHCRLI